MNGKLLWFRSSTETWDNPCDRLQGFVLDSNGKLLKENCNFEEKNPCLANPQLNKRFLWKLVCQQWCFPTSCYPLSSLYLVFLLPLVSISNSISLLLSLYLSQSLPVKTRVKGIQGKYSSPRRVSLKLKNKNLTRSQTRSHRSKVWPQLPQPTVVQHFLRPQFSIQHRVSARRRR